MNHLSILYINNSSLRLATYYLIFVLLTNLRISVFGFDVEYDKYTLLPAMVFGTIINYIFPSFIGVFVFLLYYVFISFFWIYLAYFLFHKNRHLIEKKAYIYSVFIIVTASYAYFYTSDGYMALLISLGQVIVFSTSSYLFFDNKFSNKFFFILCLFFCILFPPAFFALPVVLIFYYPLMRGFQTWLMKKR